MNTVSFVTENQPAFWFIVIIAVSAIVTLVGLRLSVSLYWETSAPRRSGNWRWSFWRYAFARLPIPLGLTLLLALVILFEAGLRTVTKDHMSYNHVVNSVAFDGWLGGALVGGVLAVVAIIGLEAEKSGLIATKELAPRMELRRLRHKSGWERMSSANDRFANSEPWSGFLSHRGIVCGDYATVSSPMPTMNVRHMPTTRRARRAAVAKLEEDLSLANRVIYELDHACRVIFSFNPCGCASASNELASGSCDARTFGRRDRSVER
jgi:hypothetical protein